MVYSGISLWDSWFIREPNIRLKRTFCLYWYLTLAFHFQFSENFWYGKLIN
jgi:hypothetical protein